jgi:hypothetical protein
VKIHSDLYPSFKIPNLCKEFQIGFYSLLIFARFSLRADPVRVRELPYSSTNSLAHAKLAFAQNSRTREPCSRTLNWQRASHFSVVSSRTLPESSRTLALIAHANYNFACAKSTLFKPYLLTFFLLFDLGL